VGNLDFLLVRASHLFASAVTTLQRKQAIFSFWTKMIELKALKLVQNIGICDFSIIEMEFIYQLFPNDPPQVLSVEASIASPILLGTSFSFSKVLSFAHSKQMDVIVRFPLSMEAMPLANQAKWNKLTQEIAAIHSEMKFENAVVNEADKAPYVIEKCHRKDVECLHVSLIVMNVYLLKHRLIMLVCNLSLLYFILDISSYCHAMVASERCDYFANDFE
jgi:diketogulonate reductase-like aldo/keto reductase